MAKKTFIICQVISIIEKSSIPLPRDELERFEGGRNEVKPIQIKIINDKNQNENKCWRLSEVTPRKVQTNYKNASSSQKINSKSTFRRR